jgi:hypothetical protein
MANTSSSGGSMPDGNAPLWTYVTRIEKSSGGGGNMSFKCNYCQEIYKGSYSRVKAHLLRIPNVGIKGCPKVTAEHKLEMQKLQDAADQKKISKESTIPLPPGDGSESISSSMFGSRKRKLTGKSPLEMAFNNGCKEHLTSLIARMFYSGGIPFHFARNPHYVNSYKYAANNVITGYVPPGYNALRTTLLQKERANVERMLKPIKDGWKEKGVSVVSDGWTDPQRRPLINFMATSEGAPVFLKAIDGTKEYKDKYYISELLMNVIKEIGPEKVVQVITDNAYVMKAAGSLIEAEYPHIFWTPCVVHTLNLALKNICAPKNTERNAVAYAECNWIAQIADDASFIRVFITNHSMRLVMFNEISPLKLLSVADTRFASILVTLKRMKLIKRSLQSMVISEEWTSYKEDDVGKATRVRDIILDDLWWDRVDYIILFTSPIYDMLRAADTDRPTLHLVYDMWDTMIEKVKAIIFRHEGKQEGEVSTFYNVVYDILIDRWTKNCTPLHCMAHSLNPK